MPGEAETRVVREVLVAALGDLRRVWPRMLLVDLVWKLLAFIVLAPVVSLALELFVSLSGESALVDQDILYLVLRPTGFVAFVVVVALVLTVGALEQACLMAMAIGAAKGTGVDLLSAFLFSFRKAGSVIRLSLEITVRCLLISAPFLVAIGLVYRGLLSTHDINYYLAERPPAWFAALGLAGAVVSVMAIVLVPRMVGWGMAMPLVLLENLSPRAALQESRERTRGRTSVFMTLLVGWGVGAFLVSNVPLGLLAAAGRSVAPLTRGSVELALALMVVLFLLSVLVTLATSMVNAAMFAILVVRLYDRLGRSPGAEPAAILVASGQASTWQRVSPKWVFVVLIGLAVVAGWVAAEVVDAVRVDNEVLVIAHRGAAGAAPENTRASVLRALNDGADMVEIDVQETADGRVVVIHDSDFMKVARNPLKIWEARSVDLDAIDIGSWFDPQFAAERVPLLSEVLEMCRGRARVNIELKYYGHDERLEERVVEIVDRLGMAPEVVVMSLKYPAVQTMRRMRPDWTLGLLAATFVGDLSKLDADFLAVSSRAVDRGFVRAARARHKDVYAWTVNDPVQMFRLAGLGVDGLITDEPALARRVLEKRRELSTVERLVVGLSFYFGAAAADPAPAGDLG